MLVRSRIRRVQMLDVRRPRIKRQNRSADRRICCPKRSCTCPHRRCCRDERASSRIRLEALAIHLVSVRSRARILVLGAALLAGRSGQCTSCAIRSMLASTRTLGRAPRPRIRCRGSDLACGLASGLHHSRAVRGHCGALVKNRDLYHGGRNQGGAREGQSLLKQILLSGADFEERTFGSNRVQG